MAANVVYAKPDMRPEPAAQEIDFIALESDASADGNVGGEGAAVEDEGGDHAASFTSR
jgi:hypothetical protein